MHCNLEVVANATWIWIGQLSLMNALNLELAGRSGSPASEKCLPEGNPERLLIFIKALERKDANYAMEN